MPEVPFQYGFSIEAKGQTPPLIHQVHGKQILFLSDKFQRDKCQLNPQDGDGIYTKASGAEIYVFTADCLPVLFHFKDGGVAALHCGWRSLAKGIVGVLASHIQSPLLTAILGPSIGPCCYEVKADFITSFVDAKKDPIPFIQQCNEKTYFDLAGFAKADIHRYFAGVKLLDSDNQCTYCTELPSYRRSGNTHTRIRSWIRARE